MKKQQKRQYQHKQLVFEWFCVIKDHEHKEDTYSTRIGYIEIEFAYAGIKENHYIKNGIRVPNKSHYFNYKVSLRDTKLDSGVMTFDLDEYKDIINHELEKCFVYQVWPFISRICNEYVCTLEHYNKIMAKKFESDMAPKFVIESDRRNKMEHKKRVEAAEKQRIKEKIRHVREGRI